MISAVRSQNRFASCQVFNVEFLEICKIDFDVGIFLVTFYVLRCRIIVSNRKIICKIIATTANRWINGVAYVIDFICKIRIIVGLRKSKKIALTRRFLVFPYSFLALPGAVRRMFALHYMTRRVVLLSSNIVSGVIPAVRG